MNFVEVSIKGIAPLLFHRFDETITGKPDPNKADKEIAEPYLYKNELGIYTPAEHIERTLQKAGTQFKYKNKKTYLDFIKSGIFVKPDAIVHKHQDWLVDKRSVVIQRSRIMRLRPRMDKWELDFQLEIINKDIDVEKINEILIYAGQFVGIGDYRPKYGRFMVTKYDFK